jgi:hypothetical protein
MSIAKETNESREIKKGSHDTGRVQEMIFNGGDEERKGRGSSDMSKRFELQYCDKRT